MSATKDPIVAYYDELAPRYDADRFGGSYGRFIDNQEQHLLRRWLPAHTGPVLDLGCGTGRLSHFATHGCDASPASIAIARAKHPGKAFDLADVAELPYSDETFSALLCFHVGMHLEPARLEALFAEAARVLQPDGIFVMDIASATRRRIARRMPSGWHGDTSLTRAELAGLGRTRGLRLSSVHGIAMAPIHRFPGAIRPVLQPFDRLACMVAPSLASYLATRFIKGGME
ncbi:MAG: class I SAM-dependent methyltransferase [Novosphingobium sp.]